MKYARVLAILYAHRSKVFGLIVHPTIQISSMKISILHRRFDFNAFKSTYFATIDEMNGKLLLHCVYMRNNGIYEHCLSLQFVCVHVYVGKIVCYCLNVCLTAMPYKPKFERKNCLRCYMSIICMTIFP